jgi:hypothetical protein
MESCLDTGSDVNIISQIVALRLGYNSYEDVTTEESFTLATGKVIHPIGRIQPDFWIGDTPKLETFPISCNFYVFSQTAAPIIMGMPFMELNKVMARHRPKMVEHSRSTSQALSVCSVGLPRVHMMCDIDYEFTVAFPDSGSEIDLVSLEFANNRGFIVHAHEEIFELADQSTVISTGFVQATLSIDARIDGGRRKRKSAVSIDFLVLDGLQHDVIVGAHHLDRLKIFSHHQSTLLLSCRQDVPTQLNLIRCPGRSTIDRIMRILGLRRHSGVVSNSQCS